MVFTSYISVRVIDHLYQSTGTNGPNNVTREPARPMTESNNPTQPVPVHTEAGQAPSFPESDQSVTRLLRRRGGTTRSPCPTSRYSEQETARADPHMETGNSC